MYQTNPDKIRELAQQDSRIPEILEAYYLLNNPDGDSETLTQIAQRYKITSERVRQLKNQGLSLLGLLED